MQSLLFEQEKTQAKRFDVDVTRKPVRSFRVRQITLRMARPMIEDWHYSNSVNGIKTSFCFGLYCQDHFIGAMIYGALAMGNAWRPYASKESEIIELRRLACIDRTPKNTESFFIGRTLRWLKLNTDLMKVVSYADAFHGHSGTIYKAANFEYLGKTSKSKIILDEDGRTFHDKAIRTTYINQFGQKALKPFAKALKERLSLGIAQYVDTPGKHIFVRNLRR
ncbi:MAG: hypothetical protein ACR2NI_11690 [Pirellulales bacterium]